MDVTNLEPQERIKKLTILSDQVILDPHVPPDRYFRTGLQMVRMANSYLDEGNLEFAYILYMKFMILFIEKIRKHPGYNDVSKNIKQTNSEKLREVLPKAEKLKKRLIEQYTKEYNFYLAQKREREQHEKDTKLQEKKKAEEREKDKIKQKIKAELDNENGTMTVMQPISIEGINFPDTDSKSSIPRTEPAKVDPAIPSTTNTLVLPSAPELPAGPPVVDRGTKPASLLSPSLHLKSFSLRNVIIPSKLMPSFLNIARRNTENNIETCGILAGKLKQDQLIITHMIVPKQKGTADSCVTMNEEEIFDFQDLHNLITLGWIHTHPTQTAFLSSVDLHTHCSYQTMMPEAIAIVCAPKYDETGFFMLTPEHGLDFISNCRQTGFHPHPSEPPLFKKAEHGKVEASAFIEVVDLR